MGANAEAIAYPIERLSRTNRTVLKTRVIGSFAGVIALQIERAILTLHTRLTTTVENLVALLTFVGVFRAVTVVCLLKGQFDVDYYS
jgi:hypothetical protein